MNHNRDFLQLATQLMKWTLIQWLLIAFTLGVGWANPGSAQELMDRRITLSAEGQPMRVVFRALEEQTGTRFMYRQQLLANDRRVNLRVTNERLGDVLDMLLKPLSLRYELLGKRILITRQVPESANRPDPNAEAPADQAISGKITDENGKGMAGVSILLKGTQRGTTTNTDGNYSITVPNSQAILVFSFVGYLSREEVVGNRSIINVALTVDNQSLSEVVVVGYGSQIKREVTGSISTLDAKQLEDQPVGQFAQKLQGRFPGVQINQTTGKPGEGVALRIRGAASINAGNNPLFVVDGLPIVGDISQINPNEIENFSVLKDAASSSLYGSRAANGVVLITTKRAKTGKTQIDFSASYGVQQVPQRGRPDLMNGTEWAQFQKEIFEDKAKYEKYTDGVPAEFQNPSQYGEGTNWYDVLLRPNAPVTNINLTIASNKDKFSSATTLGYFKQDGAMINTDFERFSFRSNNEYKITDNVRVGLNLAPNYQSSQNFNTDGAQANGILFSALTTPPIISPYNADGSLKLTLSGPPSIFTFTTPNWLRKLQEGKNRYNSFHLLTNAYAEVDFLQNFRFKTTINVEGETSTLNSFIPSTSGGNLFETPPVRASGQYNTRKYISWLNENTLTYTRNLNDHSIEALAGYSAQKYSEEGSSLFGTDFPDDNVSWIDAAATKNGGSRNTEWSLLSLIGRVNYNYKGRYLLSAAVRNDGSSRFGLNKQYGTFPSVSAGWIVSDEPFFKSRSNTLSFLKLRGSYGLTGNFNIGNFVQYGGIGSANYVFGNTIAQGRAQTNLGNPNLTWETTKQLDLGVDAGFLNDRITLTFDYYRKRTDGLLYQVDIPRASGFFNVQSNIGEFKLWGYELGISSRNLTGNLTWTTDFNFSANRSEVIQLGATNTPIGALSEFGFVDVWRTEPGQPIGQFYGFVFDGIYQNQEDLNRSAKHSSSAIGSVKFKDLNGDGKIDGKDRTFIGNPNPKFVFGLNNNFTYRNFDLSLAINGAVGGKVWNVQREWSSLLQGFFNAYSDIKDRWRSPENPGAGEYGRTLAGTEDLHRLPNSQFVSDASYLKVQNITLGYSLPLKIAAVQKVRFFGSIQNALVLTNYEGSNPEVSLNGLDGLRQGADVTAYPLTRTLTLGLNASF